MTDTERTLARKAAIMFDAMREIEAVYIEARTTGRVDVFPMDGEPGTVRRDATMPFAEAENLAISRVAWREGMDAGTVRAYWPDIRPDGGPKTPVADALAALAA